MKSRISAIALGVLATSFCIPVVLALSLLTTASAVAAPADMRDIKTGFTIPDEGYCDQPYVVITKDGNWLCTLTTGIGHEGQRGQHVVATISADCGKTWGPPIDIEPSTGPEASWVVPLVVPSGRVYAFYTYNGDRIDTLPGSEKKIRADTLGWYCYKYSDDNGRTWSAERYRLPMRVTACDRANNWHGKVQIFWGIDKPKVNNGVVTFAFTKLGRYMLEKGEGWLHQSDNLLAESDLSKIRWRLLPDGEHGVRLPQFGSTQEEHNHVPLDENGLYLVYRTTTGYPVHCYSNDSGRTWSKPEYMTYTPGGRTIKTPRACPKLWRCKNGKYLLWFHNHSGQSYVGRNPVWISGGEVRDGKMHWSQPEILLYHNNPNERGMSYPDLIEQDGRYWVTETQKTVARVHSIDTTLLEGLWRQGEDQTVADKGLVLDLTAAELAANEVRLPDNLSLVDDLTLDVWLKLDSVDSGQMLLDSRDDAGHGVTLSTVEGGAVRIELADGKTTAAWQSDPGSTVAGKLQHVVAIVDAGPKIISFVINGQLCDGGEHRQFGWGRFEAALRQLGSGPVRAETAVQHLRVYNRYLRTSEAVANHRAGL
ncbi:MAG: exo-alpha-sialidase [Phycisphaerales bacterium]|nr:MAG: exo-alpha-sialidase [Phycisphaerales bacterium]